MTRRTPEPFEPEYGPQLSPEHLDRIVREHAEFLETERDRLGEVIRMRIQLARYTTSWPDAI